jgi:hypothetical protein
MIFKNKNAGKSSIFQDTTSQEKSAPVDPAVLESFFRKQTSKKAVQSDGTLLNSKITRSSSSSDASVPSDNYVGKYSSRSIFAPDTVATDKITTLKSQGKSEFLPNVKQSVSEEIAEDLSRFKGNFSPASKDAGSHGHVRKDRISIFDKDVFERIESNTKAEEKVAETEEKKISKSLRSTDIVDSLWSKISSPHSEKSKSSREKAIDKLFGDKNA